MKKLVFITLLFMLGFQPVLAGDARLAPYKNKVNRSFEKEACDIAARAVDLYITRKETLSNPDCSNPLLKKPAAVFVTIVRHNKVVGCMGTLEPQEPDMAHEIIRSAINAATIDPWHDSLCEKDLPGLQYVISIVGKLQRVNSVSDLAPHRLGLLVRRGNRSALLLPGEAKTAEWQIFQCKRKAGIPQHEPVEMFIFETVTLGP